MAEKQKKNDLRASRLDFVSQSCVLILFQREKNILLFSAEISRQINVIALSL